jgi:amino acid transporter
MNNPKPGRTGNSQAISNAHPEELAALGSESPKTDAQDLSLLHALGYRQELARRLSGFSNFALSLSIICILAGGVTSFHLGLCSTGGASIGLGWPLVVLFALAVAASMGQLASSFPTAGGLYHWSAILGGRGWGWATAWFNLAGLVTVLAAINVGTYRFAADILGYGTSADSSSLTIQAIAVALITASQAAINHRGIATTARLTDFSGYWILVVSGALTACLLFHAASFEPARLVTFQNYSGSAGGEVWPATNQLSWLFALGALLPAYTITGFDASAHAAEETHAATIAVPRGILRSVLVSGAVGWVLLCAVVLAAPSVSQAAARGTGAFLWIVDTVLPRPISVTLCAGIVIAQYLCGLATVTSASRIAYAFARDGGLPFSRAIRHISPSTRSPAVAIWAVSITSVLFTLHTPVYSTITAICTIFLYISYSIPTAIGAVAYRRTWTAMGPWDLGLWYRPLAIVSIIGCVSLIVIGMQPPNQDSVWVVGATALALLTIWFAWARRTFPGPPRAIRAASQSPVSQISASTR